MKLWRGSKRWKAKTIKVVCVVDKACEKGRVRKEVERLHRERLDGMNWKQDPIDSSCVDHSAIWGEHPGVNYNYYCI